MNIQEGISKVVSNQDLQKQEMSSVMFEILGGKATDAPVSYTHLTLPTIDPV